MARLRRPLALAAIVSGAALLVVAAAATVNGVRVLMQLHPANQIHDTYFVVPSIWTGLLIYAAGVVGDIAFRGTAKEVGRPAPAIWQSHLLLTTLLLIVALAARVGTLVDTYWQMALVLNATLILLLLAHGAALALGGALLLRARTS